MKGSLSDTGSKNTELLYSLEGVLGYLGVLNRAKTQEEIHADIIQLIEAIGKYSKADRVYIFECIDGENAFANTFEWCDKDVIPQINNLQKVEFAAMPYWYQMFSEGSSIVIDDIENVREYMPSEYQMLKDQSIVAEISFPMYHAGELLGFVGMDNPQIRRVQALINLLDIVGGQLGSILSSFHITRDLVSMEEEAGNISIAKTEFLSGMAHDIRTPLCAIRGFAEVAKENITDKAKVLRGLEQIDAAARYLEHLADNVLNMRKLERGELQLAIGKVSVTKVFHEYAGKLYEYSKNKDLKLQCEIGEIYQDIVYTDREKLDQILTNLLSNAVKYTPSKETAGFRMYQQKMAEEGKVRLVIDIWDTGVGISEEYRDKIFESFQREEDTRVSQIRGIGLGLSLVKRCMELLGGTIQVESEKGKGTSFQLGFDLTYAIEEQPVKREDFCSGMHLLVAEDNDLNYEILEELLKIRGITCDRAADGAVCVERFRNHADGYDAILMDIQMPVMDGIEAARVIRQSEKIQRAKIIPIIAVTANSSDYDIECCLKAGMNEHMAKPVDMEKLIGLLEKNCREENRQKKI